MEVLLKRKYFPILLTFIRSAYLTQGSLCVIQTSGYDHDRQIQIVFKYQQTEEYLREICNVVALHFAGLAGAHQAHCETSAT